MKRWSKELAALEARGMRRTLRTVDGQGPRAMVDGRDALLLCSNNYLGLAGHPALLEAAAAATYRYGAGSGASRLVSGTLPPHAQLEERLAAFKGTEAALLFNSGFAANTGILQGLFGPDDVIFSDELNHASLIDGCRLSRARTVVYPHGDAAALEVIMNREARQRRGRWLIVTDGIFSMDGDIAPLPALCTLKERFAALLMVDDAHGTGVLGATGRGTGEQLGCLERIDLQMGTLGKALGCAGAYLAAPRVVIDTLINRSRPFIFSTSLPPAVPAAALAALDLVESDAGAQLRARLVYNRALFAGLLRGEPAPTMAITHRLLADGIFLQGIRPPTVPAGTCRLRATVMASHDPQDLTHAAERIVAACAAAPS